LGSPYWPSAAFSGQGLIREIVIGRHDWTRLDSFQVLTKWFNVTPNAAGAV
jgi:hypothetical protein